MRFMQMIGWVFVLLCFILAGCSSSGEEKATQSPSMEELEEQIKENADFSFMQKDDAEKLEKLYNINVSEIEDFVLYTATTNFLANEFLIIKLSKETNIADLKAKLEERVEKQKENFRDYLPEQVYLLENRVLINQDFYILLVVSEEAREIELIFENAFTS